MRRKDREITALDEIQNIIDKCREVRLAMICDGEPYIVALNFGYDLIDGVLTLYLHGAREGKKITTLKNAPDVFFQMNCDSEPIVGSPDRPCAFGWKYKSVAGRGKARFIDTQNEKIFALNKIIAHTFGTNNAYDFPCAALADTCVFAVDCIDFTAKHRS